MQQDINIVRILHYIGTLELGGSQAFVMELYRNIDRRRVQFDFVIFPGWRGPLYDEILSLGGRIYECPKYNGINHFCFVKWWDKFLKQHQEYKVIHGHVRSVASIYLPIAKRNNRYTILHSHSISNGHGLKAFAKTVLQKNAGQIADYYMACSEEAGNWLFGEKVTSSDHYMTITNAINIDRFSFSLQFRHDVRNEYDKENSFIIGHVGRIEEVKNHFFLLEILDELVNGRGMTDCVLMLVGDGSLKESLQHEAKKRGILDNVIFAGNRTDTERYYSAMDMFAFPSKWEGLGIAAVEAQVSGLNCIISEGIPEKVDIGANLITRLPLTNSTEWCDEIARIRGDISRADYSRTTHNEEAMQAGYDVKSNASLMEDFYYQKTKSISDAT